VENGQFVGEIMQNSKSARALRARFMGSVAFVATIACGLTGPALATVTPETVTPASVVDTNNTAPYWVGVAIRSEAGNSGGTCTGLLINPRTVIFAAHCVDGFDPDAYDTPTTPGNRAQVGYTTDPTFGRTNLREFLFGLDFVVPAGDARTITASSVNVWYDPRSRFGSAWDPANGTFLPADVAIAAFGTPNELLGRDAAAGVALLFSQVTGTVPVTIGGYGQSGNGFTGARTSSTVEESFFRRLAQNTMSFLGDERTIDLGVYGAATAEILSPAALRYQDLYWADFDDPLRATRPFFAGPGTLANSTLDFDVFPGNAVTGEAITAAGDSGSPLVTTAFGRAASLGVLSQGSRFFHDSIGNTDDNFVRTPAFSNYGTTAGYNPLFLFWDQIVVNNPYKYVTTAAGDGEWTDATRWTQELDPLYMILSGGVMVNGLPTTPALGSSDGATNVGTITPNPVPPATCAFTATCIPGAGSGDPADVMAPLRSDVIMPGEMSLEGEVALADPVIVDEVVIPGTPTSEAQVTAPWSSGTLIPVNSGALTGPGSTNFVPQNTNGTAGIQNSANFFEVNLRAAGTTFLTGTTVEIDRLSIRGASSGLNIRAGATLNTTISSFVDAGTLTVNGAFNPRALSIFGGRVHGTGNISTLAGITNAGGTVAPGNSIGTLTFTGNYVQGAGGLLEIELTNGASDVLAVTGNATLGGTVSFMPFGPSPLEGQSYIFLTTGGTITGQFGIVRDLLPGALFPVVTYSSNFARVTLRSLCTEATGPIQDPACDAISDPSVQADPDMQAAIAGLQALAVVQPDLLGQALEALNPTRAHAQAMVGLSSGDLLRNQFGRRTHDLMGETLDDSDVAQADMARAQLASLTPSAEMLASAAAAALDEAGGASAPSNVDLANGYAMFFAADVALTDTDQPADLGVDEADVAALTAGLDHHDGSGFTLGAALSYLQANVSQEYGLGGRTSSDGVALSGYGTWQRDLLYADAFVSGAWHSFETKRTLLVAPFTTATATGETDASQTQAGLTLGYGLNKNAGTSFGVVGGLYYLSMDIDGYTETGAGALSAVLPSRTIDSFKTQLGGEVAFRLDAENDALVPIVRLVWNHEFEDGALVTSAGFAGAPATTFTTPGPDLGSDWATLGVGLSGRVSDSTSFYFRYQHDIGRDGQQNQEVSAAARMSF
jgi:outer membrane autotransporter protein